MATTSRNSAQAHVRAADVKAHSAGRSQIGANSPETM
jgi:hypothetical protein